MDDGIGVASLINILAVAAIGEILAINISRQ